MRTRLLALATSSLLVAACGRPAIDTTDGRDGPEPAPGRDAPSRLFAVAPVRMGEACAPGERIVVAAVGDVLLHGPLQRQAIASRERFASLWKNVLPLLRGATITYANLETPTAPGVDAAGRDVGDPGFTFDGRVYSSYPQFNAHPSLLDDLKAAGVDVVSTANNHALDRRALGADRTLEQLARRGIEATGTRHRTAWNAWHAVTTTASGRRVAWIACTYGTNGIPDGAGQVMTCGAPGLNPNLRALVRELADDPTIDAVIATPHWGEEYATEPSAAQKRVGRELLEAGATAVLGTHPHVVQPWEVVRTSDGREGFIHYSTGNFVSNQTPLARQSSVMLHVGLTFTPDGRAIVNGVRWTPLYMDRSDGLTLVTNNRGAREYLARSLPASEILEPGEPLVTNPRCDGATPVPPPPGPGPVTPTPAPTPVPPVTLALAAKVATVVKARAADSSTLPAAEKCDAPAGTRLRLEGATSQAGHWRGTLRGLPGCALEGRAAFLYQPHWDAR